ncbi:MAG: hypothetical protein K2W85_15810 [Phycisphaerales bacterium]|nr:hypothetical protein [Phycisphaerales bacterium]
MSRSTTIRSFAALALMALGAPLAMGAPVTDPAGDLLNGFSAAANPDLDVLFAEAVYDITSNTFTFSSTSAGAVGTTASSSFVWGVNRGAGTAGFAANGLTNVLFDRVVRIVPGGTSQIAGGGLPAIDLPSSAITISGASITAVVPGSLLPSTGFALSSYTVNLWPRTAAPNGFAGISDFAPDTSNASVTVIPAPGAAAVFAGVAMLGMRRRRAAQR